MEHLKEGSEGSEWSLEELFLKKNEVVFERSVFKTLRQTSEAF